MIKYVIELVPDLYVRGSARVTSELARARVWSSEDVALGFIRSCKDQWSSAKVRPIQIERFKLDHPDYEKRIPRAELEDLYRRQKQVSKELAHGLQQVSTELASRIPSTRTSHSAESRTVGVDIYDQWIKNRHE